MLQSECDVTQNTSFPKTKLGAPMSADPYPAKLLAVRIVDLSFSVLAIICLIAAAFVGFFSENPNQNLIIGLGMASSAIGAFLEYRQKTRYENNHIENSLLSDALSEKYLNAVAKLRHKLVAANVLIVVAGIWISGYGVVWHAP